MHFVGTSHLSFIGHLPNIKIRIFLVRCHPTFMIGDRFSAGPNVNHCPHAEKDPSILKQNMDNQRAFQNKIQACGRDIPIDELLETALSLSTKTGFINPPSLQWLAAYPRI
jgi:hypothetical protein